MATAKDQKPTFIEQFRQSLQDVEGGYDMLAPKFDRSYYITPEALLVPFFNKIREDHDSFEEGIDIGCGTGAASTYLVGLCRKTMTAFDLSQGMLDQCEIKLRSLVPEKTVTYVKGNALNMPFHNQFDVAVSFGAFGHIREEEEDLFIRQVHAILKPGGFFFFITTGPLPFWSVRHWMQRCFNGIMKLRNLLFSPPFIMYYLTFQLPEIQFKLERAGFEVDVLKGVSFGTSHKSPLFQLLPHGRYFMVKAAKKEMAG